MKVISRAFLSPVLLLALVVPAFSYEIPEAVYPILPETAPSAESFVPPGWAIEVCEKGDLNGDKRDDLLLVLKEDNPANLMVNDPASPGVDEWDANPRMLAVAFALKNGSYRLAFQNDDILPRHEDPCIDDPFGGAEIADGAIKLGYHFWANAGSWYTASSWLSFRWRDKDFRLVSLTSFVTKRNTGESRDLSLDYASRRAEMTVEDFSDDETEARTYAKRLPRAPLLPIEEVGPLGDFYPEQSDLAWWGIGEDDSLPVSEEE